MDTLKVQTAPIAEIDHTQITARPRPLPAKPVALTIPKIVLTLDNKPEVDLRREIITLGIPIRSQGGRGTCSVFAMTFMLDFMYAKHFGVKNADFSEEFLNYASNMAIGQKFDGGFFNDIDLGYQKFGDVSEALAPYKSIFDPNLSYDAATKAKAASLMPRLKAHFIKPWDVTTGLLASQLFAIIFHLKAGRPVAAGLRWPKNSNLHIQSVLGVSMITAPAASEVFDGHSIIFVGYKVSNSFPGGGYLVFRNHWGTSFMDNGYGYMSFDYASKYTNDLVQYILP